MEFSDGRMVLTREGFEALQREMEEILTVKRPALAARLKEAIQLGDLSENFDYQDSKRQQGMLEGRLKELKMLLSKATVVDCVAGDGTVCIGSKVVVKDLDEGFDEEYMIVGQAEAKPIEGKISHESSVGAALMGHKAGDTVAVQTPAGGVINYEILSVE